MYTEKEAHYHYNLFAQNTTKAIEDLAQQGAKSTGWDDVLFGIIAITSGIFATMSLKCSSQFEEYSQVQLRELASMFAKSFYEESLKMIAVATPHNDVKQFTDSLKKGLN